MKKLLILLTFWCTAITANASLITIDIEDKVYGINDTLTANIYVSELESSLGFQTFLSAFTFHFFFDESLLDFGQVIFGNKLDVDDFFPSDRIVTYSAGLPVIIGEETFAYGLFELAQEGLDNFLLASVSFTVRDSGFAEFSFDNVELLDIITPHDFILAEGNGLQLGEQVSVPEPSTIAIFALALLMLVNITRKAKH
ncbi:MAG: PEP-CTERM sorting domain-containing protein [Cognaticolwellia sp.]|jgi:hypothetical protein